MKKRFWKIFGIVTACLIVAAVLGTVIYVENFTHSEEFVRFDKNKLNEVYTAVTLLDDEGKTMNESLSLNNCKQIPLSALHDYTYMAFVAVEDKRFFEHKGIDFRRVGGALLHNLQSGGYKEGASTISQQLIKNTHLDNSKSIKRKLNEMMLAKQLERTYGKKEILEMYVNGGKRLFQQECDRPYRVGKRGACGYDKSAQRVRTRQKRRKMPRTAQYGAQTDVGARAYRRGDLPQCPCRTNLLPPANGPQRTRVRVSCNAGSV